MTTEESLTSSTGTNDRKKGPARIMLTFDDLSAAVEYARQLLDGGYQQNGNWTLGQICRHLRLVQEGSLDGYPRWMSFFAPLRPIVRRTLLPRLMRGDSPRGIPTSPNFVPAKDVDDEKEVAAFAASVDRFNNHQGDFKPHPGFGKLDAQALMRIHAAHAAHHLGFLAPKEE